ncbi:hypothetical protein AQJ23_01735 [Streptomyces antibioticus]|nr:hypothetical protein AQJ23_01735 [Streptomyces antibioticus]
MVVRAWGASQQVGPFQVVQASCHAAVVSVSVAEGRRGETYGTPARGAGRQDVELGDGVSRSGRVAVRLIASTRSLCC